VGFPPILRSNGQTASHWPVGAVPLPSMSFASTVKNPWDGIRIDRRLFKWYVQTPLQPGHCSSTTNPAKAGQDTMERQPRNAALRRTGHLRTSCIGPSWSDSWKSLSL
jgi:hypothetical protein